MNLHILIESLRRDLAQARQERDAAVARAEALVDEREALRRVVQATAAMSPEGLARAIAVLMAKGDSEAHRVTQAALDALKPRAAGLVAEAEAVSSAVEVSGG